MALDNETLPENDNVILVSHVSFLPFVDRNAWKTLAAGNSVFNDSSLASLFVPLVFARGAIVRNASLRDSPNARL